MEEWAKITEFPGYYISNVGRVYSERSNKILKACGDSHGYYHYAFRKKGKTYFRKRYALVAWYFTHFVPHEDVNYVVHHVDESTDNDEVGNLMLVDHRYNICLSRAYPIIVTHVRTGESHVYKEGFNHWCRSMGWLEKNAASKFSRDGKYRGYTYHRTGEKYV